MTECFYTTKDLETFFTPEELIELCALNSGEPVYHRNFSGEKELSPYQHSVAHELVRRVIKQNLASTLQRFIEAGFNTREPFQRSIFDKDYYRPYTPVGFELPLISFCCFQRATDCLHVLLTHDPGELNRSGIYLHEAARFKQYKYVEFMLKAGANPNIRLVDPVSKEELELAIFPLFCFGNNPMSLLVQHGLQSSTLFSPQHITSSNPQPSLFEFLLHCCDWQNNPPRTDCDIQIFKDIINHFPQPEIIDKVRTIINDRKIYWTTVPEEQIYKAKVLALEDFLQFFYDHEKLKDNIPHTAKPVSKSKHKI